MEFGLDISRSHTMRCVCVCVYLEISYDAIPHGLVQKWQICRKFRIQTCLFKSSLFWYKNKITNFTSQS